uniref:GCN5-related N-acetyltransferase Rv2170-like domain-containing protein n=1 Tax=Oncorhynchus tshawytscha TaxID=74940 RepID=A0A8C8EPT3_ONCTS
DTKQMRANHSIASWILHFHFDFNKFYNLQHFTFGVTTEGEMTSHRPLCKHIETITNVTEFMKKVHFFCMDEEILKRMVTEENAISDAVNMKGFTLVQLMMLPDPSLLPQLNIGIELRVSSLNESHIDLVRWGLAGGALYVPPGKQLPKLWFLSFSRNVVNRNRGQGLAKALVSSMSRRLYSQGFPVYCFVEEENTLSYNLYTNLGFIEDPQYRAAWYQFNY